MTTLRPDICVIGAGSAGLSVAAAAAAFGVSVVLIEKHRMGGDCLNTGCVPSKALIAAARHAASARRAAAFGVKLPEPEIDFAAVHAHVRRAIDTIAPHDSVARFEALGVRVLQGHAAFIDNRTVAVDGTRVVARRFVIATGSRPAVPAIPGLESTPFLTNESIFDLTERPEHLVVVGGGPIGLEMAQAFRRLGSRVDVVQSGAILARDDPEAVDVVRRAIVAEGVGLHENARPTVLAHDGARITVTLPDRVLVGSHLLIATGRVPVTDGLGLDAAGIAFTAKGITVDAALRTTNPRVHAIGDVAGGPQFTHAANQHAGLVIRNMLFRLPIRANPDDIPRATYTDPELAQVGLTEAEAAARGPIRVERHAFSGNDRAVAEGDTTGFVKLVTAPKGQLLGATIVGSGADEMANLLSLALAKKLGARDLSGYVSPYPTRGEAPKRAATAFFAPYARSSLVRFAVKTLARLG